MLETLPCPMCSLEHWKCAHNGQNWRFCLKVEGSLGVACLWGLQQKNWIRCPWDCIYQALLWKLNLHHPRTGTLGEPGYLLVKTPPCGFQYQTLYASILKWHGYRSRVHRWKPSSTRTLQVECPSNVQAAVQTIVQEQSAWAQYMIPVQGHITLAVAQYREGGTLTPRSWSSGTPVCAHMCVRGCVCECLCLCFSVAV